MVASYVTRMNIFIREADQLLTLNESLFENVFPNINEITIEGSEQANLQDTLKRSHFKLFENIITLNIVQCNISNLKEDLLYDMKKLRHVCFAINQIDEIPENFFIKNVKLSHVALKGNNINEFDVNVIFRNNKFLQFLDLTSNHMRNFFVNIHSFPRLSKIKLRENLCFNTDFDSRNEILDKDWSKDGCTRMSELQDDTKL